MASRSISLTNIYTIAFYVSTVLLSLILPVLILANLNGYYKARFATTGVYQEFANWSVEEETVNEHLDQVLEFLRPGSAELDQEFFSKEDILHLYDVQTVLGIFYLSNLLLSGLCLALFVKEREKLFKNKKLLKNLTAGYLISILILFVLVLLFFDPVFILAHELVFPNDYWLLDPTSSNLIKMFPEQIFYEVFILIFGFSLFTQLLYIIVLNSTKNHAR